MMPAGSVVHALVLAVASGLVFTACAWSVAAGALRADGRCRRRAGGRRRPESTCGSPGPVPLWLFAFLSPRCCAAGGDAATPGLSPGDRPVHPSTCRWPASWRWAFALVAGLGLARAGDCQHGHDGPPLCCCLARVLWRGRLGFVPHICRRPPAAPVVRRDIARRPPGSPYDAHCQRHGHGDGRPGRPLRHRGAGRLQHRRAPGFSWWRRSPSASAPAHHAGRRGGRRRAWRRAVRVPGRRAGRLGAIGMIGWTVALMPETWSRLFARTQPLSPPVSPISFVWRRSTACSGSPSPSTSRARVQVA